MARMLQVLLLAATCSAFAAQPDRILGAIDDSQTVILKNSVPPRIQHQIDRGPVDPAMMVGYISLRIIPSPVQQAALNKLLTEQQDRSSPNYHKWLTPDQFAERFGATSDDIAKIVSWLRSQGFVIVDVARSRNWLAFSGTAAQVEKALHCSIHYYNVGGALHYANSTDVFVPKALAGVVASVEGLDDFRWTSSTVHRHVGTPQPEHSTGNGGPNFLAPDDIATIYDIGPLYAGGYDGTGMSLAIVGESDIYTSDIADFRSGFNLPAINLQQYLAVGCVDPGIVTVGPNGGNFLSEADLDLEWSGAVARNATIVYDICDYNHGGATTALQDAINNNYAPVISMSYSGCETSWTQANALALQSTIQQANTQGITVVNSSGDTGAAGCDSTGSAEAIYGIAVNLPASIPEVTGVGGTELFADTIDPSQYWGSNGPNFGSALQYISEEPWNDTAVSGGLAASGGGLSSYFDLPSWQQLCNPVDPVAPPGALPCETSREVPDVSIAASADHDGYIFCSNGSCTNGIVSAVESNSITGGTSAASPVFAGIVVLLNQYLVTNGVLSTPGLGNINPQLYSYSHASGINFPFHVFGYSGNNMVPCEQGSPDCPTNPPFQFGYSSTCDGGTCIPNNLVTGLGSPDTNELITEWNSASVATTTGLTLSSSTINVGTATVSLTATVKATSGGSTPAGTVTFYANGSQISQTGNPATLTSGVASLSYNTSSLSGGTYSITANFNPSGSFLASNASAISLAVQDFSVAANPTTVTISAPGQSGNSTLTVTPLGGFSQAVTFTCSGLPSEANCSFASTSDGATMTISTTSSSALLHGEPASHGRTLFYAVTLFGIFGLFCGGTCKLRLRGTRLFLLSLALGCCSVWVACSGGNSNPTTLSNPGTPTGTIQVTVTAATSGNGPISHNVPITLTVQ